MNKITSFQYCQRAGIVAAVLWCISFLLTMYGQHNLLLSQLGLFIGIYSMFHVGGMLRVYRLAIEPIGLGKALRMTWVIYFFATLLTTMGQFLYFQFLDGGMLYNEISQMMKLPEVKPMLEDMAKGEDLNQVLVMLTRPREVTKMMFLYNVLIGTLLTVPTALFSRIGKNTTPNLPHEGGTI